MFTGNNSDTYTEVLFSFMGNYLYAMVKVQDMYRKVASSNTSHLEAHAGFLQRGFLILMYSFEKKLIS